ncbi:PadR family transcriptional regulator [Rhodococcus sp. NPDC058505]|uniref:PadR family transcriptional regulator n=1 Tax=unclassified Rhodococcus (in: high G+C Gram-positive bacteria) TaxID=192944 RepID=UPI00365BE53E
MSPSVDRRSLILRGVLDLCVLSILRERPIYGYELTERLAERDLLVAGGSSYPLLARLERAGLVCTESRPSDSGPPRKYYSVTDLGLNTLATGTEEWATLAASVNSVLPSTNSTGEAR